MSSNSPLGCELVFRDRVFGTEELQAEYPGAARAGGGGRRADGDVGGRGGVRARRAGLEPCAPAGQHCSHDLPYHKATLSLELTELYLKLFKPLKVNKKHFQELTREAHVMRLDPGEAYAVEEVTPADERLSILIKGKMRVSCDETHLHYITPYQFVDSPEWEANREQSDDVFQVQGYRKSRMPASDPTTMTNLITIQRAPAGLFASRLRGVISMARNSLHGTSSALIRDAAAEGRGRVKPATDVPELAPPNERNRHIHFDDDTSLASETTKRLKVMGPERMSLVDSRGRAEGAGPLEALVGLPRVENLLRF
ncbi:Popeye domain-containing protein 3 [Eumeta japonica]|uniref:Popeye domain-containing protein 3 n=1 Tax=Eumeta variegata TaxID=151549 RepID=A0A4C1VYM7_EUMVA|nr:Popeye domain-containing protein 3 [Eumeta japonica]